MNETGKSADTRNDNHRYDDIIGLPHHVSPAHPPMAVVDRAAQFSPFAALTGYEDAVKETGRLTEHRMELDENCKSILDEQLAGILEQIGKHPKITVTRFQADQKKTGGTYVQISGAVKKIDEYERVIVLCDGTRIPIGEIIRLEAMTT